jgi:hypothetical protein
MEDLKAHWKVEGGEPSAVMACIHHHNRMAT